MHRHLCASVGNGIADVLIKTSFNQKYSPPVNTFTTTFIVEPETVTLLEVLDIENTHLYLHGITSVTCISECFFVPNKPIRLRLYFV